MLIIPKFSVRPAGKAATGGAIRKWLIGLFFVAVSGGLAGCVTPDMGYEDAVSAQRAAGYQWKQLEKCRPPKDDALAAPIIINGSTKLVCRKLVPPQAKNINNKPAGKIIVRRVGN